MTQIAQKREGLLSLLAGISSLLWYSKGIWGVWVNFFFWCCKCLIMMLSTGFCDSLQVLHLIIFIVS